MKNIRAGNQYAFATARDKGIVPRRFVWITAPRFDNGVIESFGLWTGDDDAAFSVVDSTSGLPVSRPYYGGVNLEVGEISEDANLTIEPVDVEFSQVAPICQEIARGHNLRLAKIEIHDGTLDPASRLPTDAAELVMVGIIDGAPIETPAAGSDGSIKLSVVSEALLMLTRKNPKKRSYEGQKRRQGDEFGLYSNVVESWKFSWGQK